MVKRLIVLTLLLGCFGFFSITVEAQTFKDVSEQKEYYRAVELLAEKGILFTEKENFYPTNIATRGQAAKLLAIAFDLDVVNVRNPGFTDVQETNQYYPYIAALANAGIVNGYEDGTFGVQKPLKRSHIAKILVQILALNHSVAGNMQFEDLRIGTETYRYVETLAAYQLVNTAMETYRPNDTLTRAHLALFLARALDQRDCIRDEVRIPIADFGQPFEKLILDEGNLFTTFIDEKTNEIVILPVLEGSTYMAVSQKPSVFLTVDITWNGTQHVVHTDFTDSLAIKYKTVVGHYFKSTDDFKIIEAFYGPYHEQPLAEYEDYLTEVQGILYEENEHKFYTLRSMDGKEQQYILVAEAYDTTLETHAYEVVNDDTWQLSFPNKQVESIRVFSGDGEAFTTRFIGNRLAIEFLAEADFAFEVKFKDGTDDPWRHYFKVIDYEGKKGVQYTKNLR